MKYQYIEDENHKIGLHDCRTNKMQYQNQILNNNM